MPQNITDSLTYTATIQSVADGDAANGADFLLAPQGLANRTAYLKSILTAGGINLIMSGNATAMQAVTPTSSLAGVANGSVFLVPGQGLYTYVSAGAATVDNLFVYSATGMGSGQWQHELLNTVVQQSHCATYTPSGTTVAQGAQYTLALAARSRTDYTLASNAVQVPVAGWYLIALSMRMQNDGASNPTGVAAAVKVGSSIVLSPYQLRATASGGNVVGVSGTTIVHITTPGTQQLTVVENSGSGNGSIVSAADATLSIACVA